MFFLRNETSLVIDELAKCGGTIHVEERVHNWCSGRSAPMNCLNPFVRGVHAYAISCPRLHCPIAKDVLRGVVDEFCEVLRHIHPGATPSYMIRHPVRYILSTNPNVHNPLACSHEPIAIRPDDDREA